MSFKDVSGQSAIEYLMTYGWMLLVVAIVGGTIFSVSQSESVDTVSGMEGGDAYINDFGVTSEDELGMDIQNRGSNSIVVSEVNVTDPETGEWVYKEFTTDSQVGVASDKIFQIPNVTRGDGANTLDVEIIYDSGGLENLSASGTISGNLQLTDSNIEYEGNPEQHQEGVEEPAESTTVVYTFEDSEPNGDYDIHKSMFDEESENGGSSPGRLEEDISEIDEIEIEYVDGAGGGDGDGEGGQGGRVEDVRVDLEEFNELYIWVGESDNAGGINPFGRYKGEEGFDTATADGGGSSEISLEDTNSTDSATEPFIAAAGAGGGSGGDGDGGDGARGGGAEGDPDPLGGEGGQWTLEGSPEGSDGEGAINGHSGTEATIKESGTTIEGGGAPSETNGKIMIVYHGDLIE